MNLTSGQSFLFFLLVVVITIQGLTSDASKVSHREGVSNFKSHSLLRPREYSHSSSQDDSSPTSSSTPCSGHGKCMSSKACEKEGGIRKMGLCSHSSEICCKSRVFTPSKCGNWSNDWVSTFTTPKYPTSFNGSTECIFTLELLPGVCAIKIDFEDVVMKGSTKYSTTHKCISDMLFILNIHNPPVEPLCDLRNYTGIVFLNERTSSRSIKFLFVIQSQEWRLKLRVTQINCLEISSWKNDPHCGRQLMYDAPLEENQLHLHHSDSSDKSKEKVLIVNGQTAEGREFPWQVSIEGTDGAHRCGASVIGPNLILSATHCFAGYNELDKLKIRLGTLNSTRDGEIFEVESVIQHYEYKTFKSHLNDIAIVKLKRNITYSQIVQPICLPIDARKFENEVGVVSGWGVLTGDIKQPDTTPLYLQKLNVRFLSNGECSEWMNTGYSTVLGREVKVNPISSTQICAVAEKNSTVCFGDSGGPLVHLNTTDGTYTQVGIVSYGVGRCIVKHIIPVVYTRVSEFLNFIAIATQL